ncbi:succinylglutamate desuccinylase/aspartoacylase family protein [Planctomycetota bacterium]|nr:succinylglutamate desuccinylase/aspartoacylase family protein [Planctomycetota bacterium]
MRNMILISLMLVLVGCVTAGVEQRPAEPHQSGPAVEQPLAEPEPRKHALPQDFVITTGVHGNEPSGARLQPELERAGFNVFGPCNPWGIKHNKRGLEDGRDLNRLFGRNDVPEAEAVKEWLKENPPAFLLDLHEDPGGEACYLIVNGPEDDIGQRIVAALKDDWKFENDFEMWGIQGSGGVLQPTREDLNFQAFMKVYSLAFYAWKTYGCTGIVVECPGAWPQSKKMKFHQAVIDTALKLRAATD